MIQDSTSKTTKATTIITEKWKWKSFSHVWLFVNPWSIQSLDSPGKNTGVGSFSLLQEIFPTQGANTGLPHCRRILHQLNPKGSPRILEWVNYPFSRESSQPRNQTRVSCIAGRLYTNWAIRENHNWKSRMKTEYRNQLSRKQIHNQENQWSPLVNLLKRALTLIIF